MRSRRHAGLSLGLMLLAVASVLMALSASGCKYEVISSSSTWDWIVNNPQLTVDEGGGATFSPGRGPGPNQAAAPRAWSVLLAGYEGEFRYANAEMLVQRIAETEALDEMWISDAGGTARVYTGRFRDVRDVRARERLATARALLIGEEAIFANATLEPLTDLDQNAQVPGGADPWDVSQYSGRYTLQIGYYDGAYTSEGGREIAAEEAVDRLRERGEPAFYYHGPNRSLVCVGLFDEVEAFSTLDDPNSSRHAQVRAYSEAVRVLRDRHPHHFANGRYEQRRQDDMELGRQPTQLIGPVGG